MHDAVMNSFVFSFILLCLCIVELVHGNGRCNQSAAAPTKYWNSHTLRCEDCTKCDKGEKLVSPCQDLKDASCEKCPEGTYLDSMNKSLCLPCSYCRQGEVVVTECASSADTVCQRIPVTAIPPSEQARVTTLSTTPTIKLISRPKTSRSIKDQEYDASKKTEFQHEKRSQYIDVVVWVLLGVVVVLLFVIFILLIKLRNRNGTLTLPWKIKAKKTPTPEGTTAPKGSILSASKASGTAVIKENNKKFSETTADVTEKLAHFLNVNNGKSWKHLAGRMGYDCNFTANLQLTPTEATQRLLQDWQTNSDATVYKLYCYLEELGRHDAMAVLLPLLTTQPVESSMV